MDVDVEHGGGRVPVKRIALLVAATLATLVAAEASAADDATDAHADERPPKARGRFCMMATPTFVAMHVYDVPVRWLDVPVGIGGCSDDGGAGIEAYGLVSAGWGSTRERRGASMWSPFGGRVVFRLEMVRLTLGFRILSMSFDPAPGLYAGEGLSDIVAMGEVGVGIDLLRVLAAAPDDVRATFTLDVLAQSYSAASSTSIAVAIGAHL